MLLDDIQRRPDDDAPWPEDDVARCSRADEAVQVGEFIFEFRPGTEQGKEKDERKKRGAVDPAFHYDANHHASCRFIRRRYCK